MVKKGLDVAQMEVFADESSSAQIRWDSSIPKIWGSKIASRVSQLAVGSTLYGQPRVGLMGHAACMQFGVWGARLGSEESRGTIG